MVFSCKVVVVVFLGSTINWMFQLCKLELHSKAKQEAEEEALRPIKLEAVCCLQPVFGLPTQGKVSATEIR